ncbi:MAG TPA: hypothetical protein DCR07_00710 [Lactococcus sp.]|nr:hypothetical protein [Lactococcus sp.]
MSEKIDTTIIEMSAVNKLEASLLSTGMIVPNISTADKVPSWDGEILLYKTREDLSKGNLSGIIPVQVKGTMVERFEKKKAVFQADVRDLRNYYNDNGAMFFLVQLKDFDTYKIYYASLLPFDLRRLLEQAEGQKTKQITLESFPHKYRDGVVRIVSDFIINKNKRAQLLPNVRSLEDLEKSKMDVEKLEFSVPHFGVKNEDEMFSEIFARPIYVYAKPQNIEASFVVDKIRPEVLFIHQQMPVVVNGEVLYNQVEEIRQPGKEKQLKIGNDITVLLSKDIWTINYSFKGTLREQIREMKMLLALAKGQEVRIGNRLSSKGNMNLNGHTLEELEKRLSDLILADAALKQLHIKKDLNFGCLSEHELISLTHLVRGIMDGISVPFSIDGKPGAGTLSIGNIKVAISSKCHPSGKGFLISDFFDGQFVLAKEGDSPENGFAISPYLLMKSSSFIELDNADLSLVAESVIECPFSEAYAEYSLNLALELIRLFDETGNNQALDVATQIINHLKKYDGQQEDLYRINQIQIEKRRRNLSKEEIKYLVSLKAPGIPIQYQLAATILLDSFQEAAIVYDQLNDREKQFFDAFPIRNLWKG